MRGYFAIGLVMPKTPMNVGSVLRAAGCFGAAFVAKTGRRYAHSPTDPQKMYRRVPLLQCADDVLSFTPFDCVPVAVEIAPGAKSLVDYMHPQRAFYVFGPEDGSVPKEVVARCRDVVTIPSLDCLNLAAAVNVVLYDRVSKGSK